MTASRIYNSIQDATMNYNVQCDSDFLNFYFYDEDDDRVLTISVSNDTAYFITEDGAEWDIDCYHRPMRKIIEEVLEGLATRNLFAR